MQKRIEQIIKILDDKKAEEIKSFNMQEEDYFVKYVIIASTLGEKHSLSLIDELKTKLKEKNETFLHIESSEDWSVIDLGDILIHLLTPQYRAIYNIEELLENLKKLKLN
ncbi:ribosome silencing factor [Campylobacter sp. 2018MI35]|uniref:ribosome silencing factor n=1 Tax=unclassified Campylobacter TaxID=2593542 RepID=UPI0019083EAA|nr:MULTISPECIES: ribosome silencing factor [unclassified Campylobacter]MBK1972304.1 ribosome silencing factor [Campylobacter sp. TTU_617]MBK1992299.1 ribosome silencing factor [Campylobacter sp. 2018MI34]